MILAALDLQPADQLKYVYDFGDWIEHTLTLRRSSSRRLGSLPAALWRKASPVSLL